MKNVAKPAAIFLYIAIMSFLLDFELAQLFDFKQICLVLIGMVILFLPGFRRGEDRQAYTGQLAVCALYASYIQTFILIFMVMSSETMPDDVFREIARGCRPLLYGVCLWIILSGDGKERNKAGEAKAAGNETNDETASPETPKAATYMTATDVYEAYRKLGLTNREAELAIRIERGLSNGEIAAELNISETTVKKHISNIFEKLDINKREQIKEKL